VIRSIFFRFRLEKAIQANRQDHAQQVLAVVFVNVNQLHLHVVDQRLEEVVVVQVLVCGVFTPKIRQVSKSARFPYSS